MKWQKSAEHCGKWIPNFAAHSEAVFQRQRSGTCQNYDLHSVLEIRQRTLAKDGLAALGTVSADDAMMPSAV